MPSQGEGEGSSRRRGSSVEDTRRSKKQKASNKLLELEARAQNGEDITPELDEILGDEKDGSMDPETGIQEAKLFRKTVNQGLKRLQISGENGLLDGQDLLRKILQRFSKPDGGDEFAFDWDKFDAEAAQYFAATPNPGFLSHSLCKDVKPRKQRVVAPREKQQVAPQKPNYDYDAESNSDKLNAMNRYRQLEAAVVNLREPIPVAKLILDPNSFEESLYNFFALTALINDHKAAMDVVPVRAPGDEVETKTMVVRPPNPELRKRKSENQDMNRRLASFGPAEWRNGVKRHKVVQPAFKFDPNAKSISDTQCSQANTQAA